MKIVLVSSEVVPFAKTGGLADVVGALPGELKKLGHEVTVFLPAFRGVQDVKQRIQSLGIDFQVPLGDRLETGQLLRSKIPDSNVNVFLVAHQGFFDRPELYGENGSDYDDNCERFTFFSRAVLEAIRILDLAPDVIHANDWQSALIPALIKCEYRENEDFQDVSTLLTIHNLAYQGSFAAEKMSVTGLDSKHFNWREMECFGRLNFLKTGIVFADSLNTVSPTYAKEIQTTEQGCGLEGVLRGRSHRLSGILNGINVSEWSPKTDPMLTTNFDSNFDVATGSLGKAQCKHDLQVEAQLDVNPDVPLIGIVGRLATQKGWSLILPVLKQFLESVDAQWVILGTGEPDYHHVLESLHRSHPTQLGVSLTFSNEYAHRIEAGSDMFLMPSQYEPCGLNQMYSMAYGTIPIVRRTGGLADTIVNANHESIDNGTANGFDFEEFSVSAFRDTIFRALRVYRDERPVWNQLVKTGMDRDWSWGASAKKYESLYRKTMVHRSMET
jgi:starch synthase